MENEITIQVANKNDLRIFTYFLSVKPPVCLLWIQLHCKMNISKRSTCLVESDPVKQGHMCVDTSPHEASEYVSSDITIAM